MVAFSSCSRILGEHSTIHSLPVLFFSFFKVEISSHSLIPLLGQVQSTVAQQAGRTVTRRSLMRNIHFNTLYLSVVNVWWCSEVMSTSKTGPLAWGNTCHVETHMACPSCVPSSEISLYHDLFRLCSALFIFTVISVNDYCCFRHPFGVNEKWLPFAAM